MQITAPRTSARRHTSQIRTHTHTHLWRISGENRVDGSDHNQNDKVFIELRNVVGAQDKMKSVSAADRESLAAFGVAGGEGVNITTQPSAGEMDYVRVLSRMYVSIIPNVRPN